MSDKTLPDYEPMLEAYHQAFARELEAMVRGLPILEGNLVLEMACGDGAYTPWLIDLTGPEGLVVALDLSQNYLKLARKVVHDSETSTKPDFLAASIDRLPFPDQTFDAVWCAQSLFSLPEPIDSVKRMAQVVKKGGFVAILEDDTLHQVMLPWPIEIELAVRRAEWESLQEEAEHPRKFYVGRQLVSVLRQVGLIDVQIRSYATSRIAPLDPPVRRYLQLYLEDLRQRVTDRLELDDRKRFLGLTDPESSEYLIDQVDFQVTLLDHVVHGRMP